MVRRVCDGTSMGWKNSWMTVRFEQDVEVSHFLYLTVYVKIDLANNKYLIDFINFDSDP